MTGLDKRVGALEAIAEGVRYRPHRIVAAELRLDPDALIARCKEIEALRDRMLAAGKSTSEIIEAAAGRVGIAPEELRRRAEALAERSWS